MLLTGPFLMGQKSGFEKAWFQGVNVTRPLEVQPVRCRYTLLVFFQDFEE